MSLKQALTKDLHCIFEENRLETFKNKWIYSDKNTCNAKKLAEAGFYFVGSSSEPDVVTCFFCNKSLDGWEATDDPFQEHMKHSPNCKFVQLKKTTNNLEVRQFLLLRHELITTSIERECEKNDKLIQESFDEFEDLLLQK